MDSPVTHSEVNDSVTVPRIVRTGLAACMLAIVALSGWYVGCALLSLHRAILLPQVLSISEPQAIAAGMRVAAGTAMLTDFRIGYPIIPLPYGVLEYWLPGIVARSVGWRDAMNVLFLGRLVSLLSLVIILILYWRLLRQEDLPARYAVIAALPLLWAAYPLRWAAQFAPDFPAVALSLAGWCVGRTVLLARNETRSRGNPIVYATAQALLWTAAFHFKPTMIPGVVAFLFEASAGRTGHVSANQRTRLRRAMVPLVLSAVFILSTSFALNAATQGLWYLNAVKSSAAFRFRLEYLFSSLTFHPTLSPLLIVFGMISLLLSRSIVVFRAVLATAFLECLFMMKQGSNVDYLLGSIALFGFALAKTAHGLSRTWKADVLLPGDGPAAIKRRYWIAVMVMGLMLAGSLAHNARDAVLQTNELPAPWKAEIAAARNAVRKFGSDAVLCLDPLTALRTGAYHPYVEPLQVLRLAELGMVSLDQLVKRIETKTFRLIVVNPSFVRPPVYHDIAIFDTRVREAIRRNYVQFSAGNWLIMLAPQG
ncbi:MAG: hypothetical protein ACR2IE_14765 [Candidatus Sumerlaeaceae bacterium]